MDDWTKKFEDYYFDDNQENAPHEQCPNCGQEYDDADFDFQICHFCGHDANNK